MASFLSSFQNIDLISVGVAVSGMLIIGSAVLYESENSVSNRLFFYLALTASIWGITNYVSYQSLDPGISLALLRIVMFFAVWSTFFTFSFVYVFPAKTARFPNYFKWVIAPITTFTSFLCLTHFVFDKVSNFTADGRIQSVINGPGIAIFGITVLSLNVSALALLIRKVIKSGYEEGKPLKIVLQGMSLMLSLIIVFNFILPAFFENTKFIPLGALFLFPFIAFTAYAIFKHRLFNVKIIATETLVFVLCVGMLFDLLLATTIFGRVIRFLIFILMLIIGITLIRSVRKEIEQREQLEKLSKQLEGANEQLKLLDQARAEFISIASHQLRTPPATVKWYLSAVLAGDYGKMEDGVKDVVNKAARTNNLLISLIEDMLNVSRIERGKMEFLFEPVNILEMAQVTFEQLQPLAIEKKQTLTFTPPASPLPPIMADKEKLRQVINNLIDNAIKYTPQQGKIQTKLEQVGQEIKFSVTDNGKGMDEDEKNSVFEKYKRGKDSIKQSAGLGLGLYVAKIIIDQHKGKLWAESPGPGKGSSFIFTLPINSGVKQSTLVDFSQPQK